MHDDTTTGPGTRRLREVAGMMLMGEGLLALWRPRAHCRLWRGGGGGWTRLVRWCIDHPNAVRAIAAAELATGCCIALRQESSPSR